MIYLDNAATTLLKPGTVSARTAWAIDHLGSPGRGGHYASMSASDVVFSCRNAVGQLFNINNTENIVFTFNATHGLNIAIKSLVHSGDEVVISGYEHNSVYRPLVKLGADVKIAYSPLFDTDAALNAIESRITSKTKVLVITHVSNVFGFILPIQAISDMCRSRGIHLIIDASQSAGAIPVDARALNADFIALPGHKGLYGPQGTGILICGDNVTPDSILEGGSGSNSLSPHMPDFLPDMLEAGTHNTPGIAGLCEGVKYVLKTGPENILEREHMLIGMAAQGLENIPGIRVFASKKSNQSGVLSFIAEGLDCESFAEQLSKKGVAVRAGLHCSPLAHRSAGTLDSGTVRMSVSALNSTRDIVEFLNAVEDITAAS